MLCFSQVDDTKFCTEVSTQVFQSYKHLIFEGLDYKFRLTLSYKNMITQIHTIRCELHFTLNLDFCKNRK